LVRAVDVINLQCLNYLKKYVSQSDSMKIHPPCCSMSVCSQYLENIRVVDEGIERITNMFEEVFDNDGRTTYVFTSDHGMTNWGMI